MLPSRRRHLASRLNTNLRLDTFPHAVAAGFWYLHNQQPNQATQAFEVTRSLHYGEEMYLLSAILTEFYAAENVDQIIKIEFSSVLPDPCLRPNTWQVIHKFNVIIEDVQEIKQGRSLLRRSAALNRAIGELRAIIDRGTNQTQQPKFLPEAERDLIIEIAKNWKDSLENIATEVGNISITEPVSIPYIIGDPVEGQLFVGRQDILRDLKEIWLNSSQLQSVILYGHRRMGKTSILKNINTCLDANIKLAYLNLQSLGELNHGVAEIVIAMSDEISRILKIPHPDDEKLFSYFKDKSP